MTPLCIDLFCGLGGWTRGFLAEGYDCIGFDIERHQYGDKQYPAQLILQDVLTLHGSQFRDAAVIVVSPPCQAYSYRAMPWKRAKALPPPSNELFDACFRIAQEAGVPIVVENVKGAQPWVGRAKWHYGSYYLWGDVPALMPPVLRLRSVSKNRETQGGSWFNIAHGQVIPGNQAGAPQRGDGLKGTGGGWFTPDAENRTPGHWKEGGCVTRSFNSKDPRRKAASAMIAEIPFELAQWIARCFDPRSVTHLPEARIPEKPQGPSTPSLRKISTLLEVEQRKP